MSLRRRLFISLLLASTVILVLAAVFGNRILDRVMQERAARELDRTARFLAGSITPAAAPGESLAPATRRLLRRAAEDLGLRAAYLDAEGRALLDTGLQVGGDFWPHGAFFDLPLTATARRLGFAEGVVTLVPGSEPHLVAMRALPGRAGAVVAARRLERVRAVGAEDFWPLYLVLILGFVILAGAIYVLAGRVIRPLESLATAAERVAEGVPEGRGAEAFPRSRQVEVVRLSSAFRKMHDAQIARLRDLSQERQLLRTTTENLEEGLLLVGADRRILMANRAFERVLRLPYEIVGRRLGEAVRHPDILPLVEACLDTGASGERLVGGSELGNRSYQVTISPVPLPGGQGALVVYFDVTRLEALERVRRQFVADVSHELKTPVTSIRGAIETLLELECAERPDEARFLEIALRQAERMHELITDLLDLSRIETGAIRLQTREVELRPIIEAAADAVRARRGEAGHEVVIEVPEGFRLQADPRRIEQVLVNLIDNACKYGPAEGRVEVRASEDARGVTIAVEDEGPGIPHEMMDRIFHRFVRVDEDRARHKGGTGLGLSIVKHLMHLHGGEVRVVSEAGRGATFLLEFPPAPAAEEVPPPKA